MSRIVVTSSAARTRIQCAEAWLESRNPGEELLVIGATLVLDAANELAGPVCVRAVQRACVEVGLEIDRSERQP